MANTEEYQDGQSIGSLGEVFIRCVALFTRSSFTGRLACPGLRLTRSSFSVQMQQRPPVRSLTSSETESPSTGQTDASTLDSLQRPRRARFLTAASFTSTTSCIHPLLGSLALRVLSGFFLPAGRPPVTSMIPLRMRLLAVPLLQRPFEAFSALR